MSQGGADVIQLRLYSITIDFPKYCALRVANEEGITSPGNGANQRGPGDSLIVLTSLSQNTVPHELESAQGTATEAGTGHRRLKDEGGMLCSARFTDSVPIGMCGGDARADGSARHGGGAWSWKESMVFDFG